MTAPEATSIVSKKKKKVRKYLQVEKVVPYDNVNNEEKVREAPWEMAMSIRELGIDDD